MRPLLILGLFVAAFGGYVLLRGASYRSRDDIVKIGDVKVTADARHSVPPWVGGVAVLAGIGLMVAGARKRA